MVRLEGLRDHEPRIGGAARARATGHYENIPGPVGGWPTEIAARLRQVFLKAVSLRRNPYLQDAKELKNFHYQGMKGLRVDQGEYRIVYALDEAGKIVYIALILSRSDDYRELEGHGD